MSSLFNDYEVLSILGGKLSSACYKVRNKVTGQLTVFKVIPYAELNEEGRENLLNGISRRISLKNANVLQYFGYILHEESNILYLNVAYCHYGTLRDFIDKCIGRNEYLNEDFIWYVLGKLTNNYKHRPEVEGDDVSIDSIFLDESFNIKHNCFDFGKSVNKTSLNVIGDIIYRLCTLEVTSKFYGDIPSLYSESLKDVIAYLLKTDTKQSLDVILWHPTIVSKSIQIFDFESTFVRKTAKINEEEKSRTKLEKLRNREHAIKVQEEKIKEMQRDLDKREKKVALLEHVVKDKITQADLHLKRARNQKHKQRHKINYENMDTSLSADCSDTIIFPTSGKLCKEIGVQKRFSRTMSERQVKFKGHSPLKAIHNIQNTQKAKSIDIPIVVDKKSVIKPKFFSQTESDLTSDCNSEKSDNSTKNKKKFSLMNMFNKKNSSKTELNEPLKETNACSEIETETAVEGLRPISWTEGNKRQAFDLLRIMNDLPSPIDDDLNLKHTYM